MQKYKFVFNTCECSNYASDTDEKAVEAAKQSLQMMHKVNPHIRYVMVAKVLVKGCYYVVGRHEL